MKRLWLGAACAVLSYLAADAAGSNAYNATVVKVTDGDTIRVLVPAWRETPFGNVSIRIAGIDTPETRRNQAKCPKEVLFGKSATAFARTLLKPGDSVRLVRRGNDKFMRIDGDITLPDGRDFGQTMLSAGYAKPYNGRGKPEWCD